MKNEEEGLEQSQDLDRRINENQLRITEFAISELRDFHEAHQQQINPLMGFLVQSKDLAKIVFSQQNGISEVPNMPQQKWLIENYLKPLQEEEEQWSQVEAKFVREYTKQVGLSQESGLLLTTQASTLALPKLAKTMQLLKTGDWMKSAHVELPVEIDLGQEFKFHDVFICPVSKEPSGVYGSNPPMLLTCGHVISKNSLNRIARPAGRDGKFKCHTCPTQMTIDKVVEIRSAPIST